MKTLIKKADQHVQMYGSATGITDADQLPRNMGVLIMVAARAIEKYCGTPKAVMILLKAASVMLDSAKKEQAGAASSDTTASLLPVAKRRLQ